MYSSVSQSPLSSGVNISESLVDGMAGIGGNDLFGLFRTFLQVLIALSYLMILVYAQLVVFVVGHWQDGCQEGFLSGTCSGRISGTFFGKLSGRCGTLAGGTSFLAEAGKSLKTWGLL